MIESFHLFFCSAAQILTLHVFPPPPQKKWIKNIQYLTGNDQVVLQLVLT